MTAVAQGWVSDMEIDGSTFVPKKCLIFTNLSQGLSKNAAFFLIFEPILWAGFFMTKYWLFQKTKSTFVLVSGCFTELIMLCFLIIRLAATYQVFLRFCYRYMFSVFSFQ